VGVKGTFQLRFVVHQVAIVQSVPACIFAAIRVKTAPVPLRPPEIKDSPLHKKDIPR